MPTKTGLEKNPSQKMPDIDNWHNFCILPQPFTRRSVSGEPIYRYYAYETPPTTERRTYGGRLLGLRRQYCWVACLDSSSYLVFPMPSISVGRAYGTVCSISLISVSNRWTPLNIRFCVALFTWELCVGLRWDAR